MYVIGINGSPRKHGNTATLLEHSLKGAESEGATTELVHLLPIWSIPGTPAALPARHSAGRVTGGVR